MLGTNQSKRHVTDCRCLAYFLSDAETLGCSLVFTACTVLKGSQNPLKRVGMQAPREDLKGWLPLTSVSVLELSRKVRCHVTKAAFKYGQPVGSAGPL